MEFTPDGRTLVTDDGKALKLWEMPAGVVKAVLREWQDEEAEVRLIPKDISFRLVGAGKFVVLIYEVGQPRFWETETGRERKLPEKIDISVDLCFPSPDGVFLAADGIDVNQSEKTSRSSVEVWRWAEGRRVATMAGYGGPVFSPDGRLLAVTDERSIKVWDLAREPDRYVLQGKFAAMAFSPRGDTLAAIDGPVVRLWDLRTGEPRAVFPFGKTASVLAFSLDGRCLAAAAAGSSEPEQQPNLKAWDLDNGEELVHFTGPMYAPRLWFGRSGKVLAVDTTPQSGVSHCVTLWDVSVSPGRQLGTVSGGSFGGPDGAILSEITRANGVGNPFVGRRVGGFVLNDPCSPLQMSLSANDQLVAFAADFDSYQPQWRKYLPIRIGERDGAPGFETRLWDLACGREQAVLPGCHSPLFSPDGTTLVTRRADGNLVLWDVPPAKTRQWLVALPGTLVGLAAGMLRWRRVRRRSRATA